MKINLMLKYFISIITFLFVNITIGNVNIANDTLEKFGVRAGLDLNKIIRSVGTYYRLKAQMMNLDRGKG